VSRVSSKQTNFFSVRTEINRNSICFGSFSVCFAKPITNFFGLFRFVAVFRTCFETTETNGSVSKQTEKKKNLKKFTEKEVLCCQIRSLVNISHYTIKRNLKFRLPVLHPDPPIRSFFLRPPRVRICDFFYKSGSGYRYLSYTQGRRHKNDRVSETFSHKNYNLWIA
jgi:hypothetical protein